MPGLLIISAGNEVGCCYLYDNGCNEPCYIEPISVSLECSIKPGSTVCLLLRRFVSKDSDAVLHDATWYDLKTKLYYGFRNVYTIPVSFVTLRILNFFCDTLIIWIHMFAEVFSVSISLLS